MLPTSLCVDPLYESLDVILLGHVAYIALDIGDAGFLVAVEASLHELLVDVVEDDGLDVSCGESLGDVETDTVGSTCDPGVLSFE